LRRIPIPEQVHRQQTSEPQTFDEQKQTGPATLSGCDLTRKSTSKDVVWNALLLLQRRQALV
jgi:hypothetical protein